MEADLRMTGEEMDGEEEEVELDGFGLDLIIRRYNMSFAANHHIASLLFCYTNHNTGIPIVFGETLLLS